MRRADKDVTVHLHEELWLSEEKTAFKVVSRVYSQLCPGFPRDYQMPDLLMAQAKSLISHGIKKMT